MRRSLLFLCVTFLIMAIGGFANATPYYAITNQIGYSGTVTYTPIGESDPVVVNTSSPRNGYIYILNDADTTDFNIFMSNWDEHPPSNVHDSFFQLYDENADTVTITNGGWDSSFNEFSFYVTGENASYTDDPATNDYSRAWMPDQGVAARGTWTNYTLSLTASGMSVVIDDGWYVNAIDPLTIHGTFTGTFVSEERTYSNGLTTFENTYFVELELSSDIFDSINFTGEIDNEFGAPVPEPATMLLLGTGLVGLAGFRRRFRKR